MNMVRTTLRRVSIGVTVTAAVLACVSAQSAPSAQVGEGGPPPQPAASAPQNIGLVSGLALGAAAGGPVGAIIGAAAGAWAGDRYHRQAAAHQDAAASLRDSEAERARLTQNLTELHGSLSREQDQMQSLDRALDATNEVQADIGFRTDADTIEAQAVPPLLKLGALAAALPDASVRIVGYADPRGSTHYNMELSRRRAQAVAEVLAMSGIDPQRLIVEARGSAEAESSPGDADGNALDRRVSVRIERGQPLARND
ncbi:MAG: OmpA family protein [Sinobacteraceae bacterium]|nr:OmpA family protein [Nevskiaceae bacterium]